MVKKNKVELKPTHGKGNSKQQEFMHLFLWGFTLLFMTWTQAAFLTRTISSKQPELIKIAEPCVEGNLKLNWK